MKASRLARGNILGARECTRLLSQPEREPRDLYFVETLVLPIRLIGATVFAIVALVVLLGRY